MNVRYSIVCQGSETDGHVVCPGWGRWDTLDEKCPTCGQKVKVTGAVAVTSLEEGARCG